MKFEASPQQRFLILSMAFAETLDEREPTFSDAPIKKSDRDKIPGNLVGFKAARGQAKHLVLQDDAWEFVIENLGLALPDTKKAAQLLQRVFSKLRRSVGADSQALRHFIGDVGPARPRLPKPPAKKRASPKKPKALPATEDGVRQACLSLSGGQTGKRIRLADLRAKVAGERGTLDSLLKSMQQAGRLVLFKMDNPAEITPADESAALIIAGNPRHLVYLEA